MSAVEGVVIVALGNAFRGDDAVGLEVARRLRRRCLAGVTIEQPDDALAILEACRDAALAIAVDAAVSGSPPGTIHRRELGDRPVPKHLARCSIHGFGLAEALELGGVLERLPARFVLYAVEGARFDHGSALSPEVDAAIDDVVSRVLAEIGHAE
jgi:hydrogenase maturation protease